MRTIIDLPRARMMRGVVVDEAAGQVTIDHLFPAGQVNQPVLQLTALGDGGHERRQMLLLHSVTGRYKVVELVPASPTPFDELPAAAACPETDDFDRMPSPARQARVPTVGL